MDTFVARQPIFDTLHRVVGYELLHRSKEEAGVEELGSISPALAEGGILEGDAKDLTGGKAAFVSFSRESLLKGLPEHLEPKGVIIQLQEAIAPDDEVVAACRDLASRGFHFAVGDFAIHEKYSRLLRLAEVVKVDVQESVAEEKVALLEKLGAFKGKLLAEKVENQAAHEYCKTLGFQLFQGFHYFRPETFSKKDLSTSSVSVVRLLNLLRDQNATDRAIQEGFRSDPALSFKLLELVNSAALGGRGIDSIPHAMRLLGRDPLYRWLSMFLLADGRDRTEVRAEIVKSSLMRGRMCELIGESCGSQVGSDLPAGGTLFLIGLFSQLDTLLQASMEDVLARIDLAAGVKEALLEREGKAGLILSAVESYEEADWDLAEERLGALGADSEILSNVYLDSVTWASNRLDVTGG